MEKQWKAVPGHDGYLVSDRGDVLSKWAKRELRPEVTPNGYLRFTLGSRQRRFLAHRLVLLAFVGPSELECNHKNGDKADNRLENLEYCTTEENNQHCCRVLKKRVGEKHANARFSDAQVAEMRRLWESGMKQIHIAPLFGTRQGVISNILRGWSRATS
jgi:hypothetical protein